MKEIATIQPLNAGACTGNCQGCGKLHIKIFGAHDTTSRLLGARVRLALDAAQMDGKVLEIADPIAIQAEGISLLPALMIEGKVVLQGLVPNVHEIARLMKNRELFNSKIFHLRTISVAVDMSDEAKAAHDAAQAATTRATRNNRLKDSDWSQGKDIPDAVSTPWATYRQALRDLPASNKDPKKIVFPTRPA
jgi:hypothetical protein